MNDTICYVLAVAFFAIAAFPTLTDGKVRFECLGFAALALFLLV